MPHRVVLHLADGGEVHIQVGVDDLPLVPHGLGDIVAEGVHDAAAAPADNVLGDGLDGVVFQQIGGVGGLADEHIRVDEEAFALDGDVLDSAEPLRVVVGVGGDVDDDPLLIQGHPGQGHIALPADEGAYGAPGGVGDGEKAPVGVAPDDPLCAGGLDLPVDLPDPVGLEADVAVKQRPARRSPC